MQAALAYLGHCREKTHTCDPLAPAPGLSKQEQAVEGNALQVLSLYLMGEMEFTERPPSKRPRRRDEDDGERERVVV